MSGRVPLLPLTYDDGIVELCESSDLYHFHTALINQFPPMSFPSFLGVEHCLHHQTKHGCILHPWRVGCKFLIRQNFVVDKDSTLWAHGTKKQLQNLDTSGVVVVVYDLAQVVCSCVLSRLLVE
jgi:hypothetical protein